MTTGRRCVTFVISLIMIHASAKISMPAWFGSNMVLQSNQEYGARSFLNGRAAPFERVTVETSSDDDEGLRGSSEIYNIQATAEGTWKLQILVNEPLGSKFSVVVSGEDGTTIRADNVTGGDVYFCSGQSNMVFPMKLTLNATEEVATLKSYPHFRFFMTNRGTSDAAAFDVPVYDSGTCDTQVPNACNRWVTPDEAIRTGFIEDFSAVCYMTVRDVARLHTGNRKPVALVQSAWGGTRVEAWMSAEAIETASRRVLDASSSPVLPPPGHNAPNMKSVLYNAMVSPFDAMSVRAALWYQGEANADQKVSPEDAARGVTQTGYYEAYLRTMIEDWRLRKGMGDFAFFVVSLPPSVAAGTPVDVQSKTGRNEIRIAEFEIAPRTNGTTCISGVPVCTELGGSSSWGFDHPFNKNEISRRLALQVVHAAFGVQGRLSAHADSNETTVLYDTLWTGPLLSNVVALEDGARVDFANWTASGLRLNDVKGPNHDGTRDDCTLCCERAAPFEVRTTRDGNWTRVSLNDTVIGEASVELRSARPYSVRYGWSDFQECVLVNNDSLPLAPFVWSDDDDDADDDKYDIDGEQVHDDARSDPSFQPPLGFNTWNFFHCNIDENEIKKIADIMVESGLADAGYEYINIDDCWQVDRLENGTIVVDPARFPSGMRALADYVHSKGLKFGVYTAQHARTCQDRPGSFDHEAIDAQTYCEWGIDYLKVDGCHGESHPQLNTSWIRFREGFDACFERTGRYTVLSVESCSDPTGCGQWIGETADLWRTGGDVQAYWASVLSNIHGNNAMASVVNKGQGRRNGHGNFNDPDMLEIGNSGLSAVEQRSMFSLWAVAGAPLLIGTSVSDMSDATLKILTNREILRINQDLGYEGRIQGTVVSRGGGWEIWAKTLAVGDSVALALVNLDDVANATIRANFTAWDWSAETSACARDLWTGENLGTTSGFVEVGGIRPHETSVILLNAASTGSCT